MTYEDFKRAGQLMAYRTDLIRTLNSVKACEIGADIVFGRATRPAQIGAVANTGILEAVKTLLTAHLEERIADLDKEFEELGGVQNG